MVTSTKRKKKSQKQEKVKKPKIDPLQKLQQIVASNYFVTVGNCSDAELINVQKFMKDHLKVSQISVIEEEENSAKFLAFNAEIDLTNKSEHFGVIIGPNAEKEIDRVSDFYNLWGKSNCQLRRFQDGETYETVSLNNPSGMIYVILAKLNHLSKIHFPNLQMKFHSFNEDFRLQAMQSHEKLMEMRRIADEFCGKLRELSGFGSEIPLRKVEPISPCLYQGDLKQNYHVVKFNEESAMGSKIAINKNGYFHLSEKSNMAPSKLNALDVELEITQKSTLSENMFARLKMAYAIKLR